MTLSLRRHYIDKLLSSNQFHGRVLDIGGEKINKRGSFRPPMDSVDSWEYINIDPATDPDYLCSAESIPVSDNLFDFIVIADVLEHLKNTDDVLNECMRILKPGGTLIATMPFLYPVHDDPDDYQRWTPTRFRIEFNKAGFKNANIEPMGSLFAVVFDLLHVSLGIASRNNQALKNRFANKFIMPLLSKIFLALDNKYFYKSSIITTGWYVTAQKKSPQHINISP